MPTIRVLNWNIQNYGETKSGLKFNNYDVVQAIAKVVVATNADIFVMLEVNTKSQDTARRLTRVMLEALQDFGVGMNDWPYVVLSPNTGVEFYAYFVKDPARTMPLPITGPVLGTAPPQVLGQVIPIGAALFSDAWHGDEIIDEWFPLIAPDLMDYNAYGRPLGVPAWPAIRRPCLGLFHIPGAALANSILPIVACHYATSSVQVDQQFETLRYFSLFRGLEPGTNLPPVNLNINIGGHLRAHQTNYYVLTGDFNMNFPSAYYAPIYQLGANGYIRPNTLLITYGAFKTNRPHNTAGLAVRPIDNFFLRTSNAVPNAATATLPNNAVPNIPDEVTARFLELKESVDHYRELDQRGFEDAPYLDITRNYANQLTNRNTMINLKGALCGSRLISDHLPTLVDFTIN
jgi:hypothetical protein